MFDVFVGLFVVVGFDGGVVFGCGYVFLFVVGGFFGFCLEVDFVLVVGMGVGYCGLVVYDFFFV